MRVLKFIAAAALLFCFVWLASCGVEWVNDTPIDLDGSRYIPMVEDTVHCDDGTDYYILDVDSYPDRGLLPSLSQEWSPDELPKREVIHYEDASGDYLFMRNLYETNRMAYAICGGESGVHIRLTVPEDILSDAFSPWDPERVRVLAAGAGHGDTVCVEAWDMFKNGVYYKTVYEIGIDKWEAGHE